MKDPGHVWQITEAELQEKCQHSSVAGEHEALKGVFMYLSEQAAVYFTAGQDDKARLVRDLAREVNKRREDASSRLQDFIKKSMEDRK